MIKIFTADNLRGIHMGVVFFAIFMFLIAVFCGIIIIVSLLIKNKLIKHLFRIIALLIMGLPVSWIIFLAFVNIAPQAMGIYLIIINVLGVLGMLLYKVYLHVFKKDINKHISRTLMFFLYLSILSDPFPALMILPGLISKLS